MSEITRLNATRVVTALTSAGVSVLMTSELEDRYTDLRFSPYGTAFPTDAIIVQRYIEVQSRLLRIMAIVKVRASVHSDELRLYSIDNDSLKIGEITRAGRFARGGGLPGSVWAKTTDEQKIMNDANGKNEQAIATAARELFLLGQKTVAARAVLAALHKELSDANTQLVDSQYVEQLIEANQQLVVAILSAQSDAESPKLAQAEQRLYLEMREANEQLVIAALSAQHLQVAAEHALEQQRNALTVVAHEMRNPLTPISMIAGRLVRVPSEELPRMQKLIEGQVQHMSRLVEDLLDVARASTGKFRLDCRIVDMVQIIQEAIEICTPVMIANNLHFSVDLQECALAVNGDPARLTQILGNLLGNAAKYTPAGGTVIFAISAEADLLEISIRDTGIGITANALPFIFEPFVQDVHAVGFNGAGLGIGLTVVRELVEAHGGTVTGTSAGEGKGSEFVVTLPLVTH